MHTPIRIAILGLGPAGTALVPEVDADARFTLAAVCDARAAALEAFQPRSNVRCHATLAALCADRAVDAVYIATPTWMHAEHAIAVLDAGKHVIVEKPMAVDVAGARSMVEAARRAQRLLIVGHSQSFEATIRVMRAVIDSGRLGRLRAINNWCYTDWMFKPRDKSEFDRALGGGVVYRQGAHQIDVMRYLTRTSPLAIQAMVGQWDAQRPGDGSYSAHFIFPDQVTGSLFYSGYDHFSATELTFGLGPMGSKDQPSYGTSRRLALSTGEAEATRKYGSVAQSRRASMLTPGKNAAFGILIVSCEHGDMRVGDEGVLVYDDAGRWSIPVDTLSTGRAALLDELARGLAGAPLTHDGLWGLANLEVCVAILAASDQAAQVRPGFNHPVAPPCDPELTGHVNHHMPAI